MKYLKTFEKMNPRIVRNSAISPFEIKVKYSHGDSDLTTRETFKFKTEDYFIRVSKFFYEIMNFKPNNAYANMGYFYPIPADVNNGRRKESEVSKLLIDIASKYGLSEDDIYTYVKDDAHYRSGYATIDGIKCSVNGQEKVYVWLDALETNKVELPNIGDIISVNVGRIPGLGKKIYGGDWTDYMPNSGIRDFTKSDFDAKVIDCSIDFKHDYDNEYYSSYTHFTYVLLLEATEDVMKDDVRGYNKKTRKLVYSINGYDPEFETKFNKKKYDDMNYYEIKL